MTWTLAVEMAILLRPQVAIYGTALKQDAVRSDIGGFALFHHQDLVAFDQ